MRHVSFSVFNYISITSSWIFSLSYHFASVHKKFTFNECMGVALLSLSLVQMAYFILNVGQFKT
jgi:hypothetical protein